MLDAEWGVGKACRSTTACVTHASPFFVPCWLKADCSLSGDLRSIPMVTNGNLVSLSPSHIDFERENSG
jgi:hypothetical protein